MFDCENDRDWAGWVITLLQRKHELLSHGAAVGAAMNGHSHFSSQSDVLSTINPR